MEQDAFIFAESRVMPSRAAGPNATDEAWDAWGEARRLAGLERRLAGDRNGARNGLSSGANVFGVVGCGDEVEFVSVGGAFTFVVWRHGRRLGLRSVWPIPIKRIVARWACAVSFSDGDSGGAAAGRPGTGAIIRP